MLRLHGFAASNYHNKVKLALIEKDLPFEEVLNWADRSDSTLAASPLSKVPFLECPQGFISESSAICEYLEQASVAIRLIPEAPYEAAKVREMVQFIELYLEWEARRVYPQALFGGKVSDDIAQPVKRSLERAVAGLGRLSGFRTYAVGDRFSLADIAAIVHLPLVSLACRRMYGADLLEPLQLDGYLARMGERPSVQRMVAERKLNQALLAERMKAAAAAKA